MPEHDPYPIVVLESDTNAPSNLLLSSHNTDACAGPAWTSTGRHSQFLIAASLCDEETHHPTKIE